MTDDLTRRTQVRSAWDAVADDYAAARRHDGPDTDLLVDLAAALPEGARVLDVGCGDGRRTVETLLDADPTLDVVGLDFSRVQLGLARAAVPAATLVQADMTGLPFSDETVDAVTAYHSVFHVPRAEHPTVYAEFARVLRPGGYVLTTVGTGRSESIRRNWLGSGHAMFWSTPGPETTKDQLEAAGFSVEWERHVDDPLGSTALFVRARRE
ncbi:SAM-dependent methyltransferase [Salinigranum rubrum]|uniref:SAM-dependent methyltransferase n=1 Tax=Salinigranum rubrum TaxID=755307 RepID=A0A2I8VJJ0_9EURY|nr:class I SAM-dependent methyltransferase [Salinigranum rubrum]AUV82086.1 SAM-dependent methyltransferase [Salinigranum rubrum]